MYYYTQIASLEKRERRKKGDWDCGPEGYYVEAPEDLWKLLTIAIKPIQYAKSSVLAMELAQESKLPSPGAQSQSAFMSLPNELLLEIINNLDFLSAFRFCLVSQRLWGVGWPQFLRVQATDIFGSWVGTEVFCKNRQIAFDSAPDADDWTAWEFQIADVDLIQKLERLYNRLDSCKLDEIKHLPPSHRRFMDQSLEDEKVVSICFPEDEHYTLRNLSLKQFVKGRDLGEEIIHFNSGRRQCFELPSLGKLALYRIAHRLYSPGRASSYQRGSWFGNKLEICTENEHDRKTDSSWKDVTGEAIEELEAEVKFFDDPENSLLLTPPPAWF